MKFLQRNDYFLKFAFLSKKRDKSSRFMKHYCPSNISTNTTTYCNRGSQMDSHTFLICASNDNQLFYVIYTAVFVGLWLIGFSFYLKGKNLGWIPVSTNQKIIKCAQKENSNRLKRFAIIVALLLASLRPIFGSCLFLFETEIRPRLGG